MLCAGLLLSLSLIGIACGGSKPEETSNAPVGKPTEGTPGPVPGGSPMSEGGAKMSDQGQVVPRK